MGAFGGHSMTTLDTRLTNILEKLLMKQEEVKKLEKVMAEKLGVPNVEIIRAEDIMKPSIDEKLLKMENKHASLQQSFGTKKTS